VFSNVNNDGWLENDERRNQLTAGNPVSVRNHVGKYPFEDWYVHPDLVDMEYVNSVIVKNANNYTHNPVCGETINFERIQY
jgi:hypothetical protein